MYPRSLQKLIDLFSRFPGIGPKQAARFAFFVWKEKNGFYRELMDTLREVGENVISCTQCFRAIGKDESNALCSFCRDTKREHTQVAVVEKESDLLNLERTGVYHGLYHVLGGIISPLDSESPKKIRIKALHERVEILLRGGGKAEVILATNPTTEGDTTALYIERILAPLGEQFKNLKVSKLGRGISVGTELEYADEITLKNSLTNRK